MQVYSDTRVWFGARNLAVIRIKHSKKTRYIYRDTRTGRFISILEAEKRMAQILLWEDKRAE